MAGRLSARRAAAVGTLGVAVTVAHLWLADGALESALGEGAGSRAPVRIDVAFVKTLVPATPPPAAAAPPPQPRARPAAAVAPRAAASAASAASAALAPPAEAEPEREPAAPPVAEAPATPPPLVAEAEATAAAAAPASAAAAASAPPAQSSTATAFAWPPSTRLSYTLSGQYRGPVEGQAQVEWLREGRRYQVRLDVSVGPSFAPLVSRRLVSDGLLGEAGLVPRRYDEETKVAFRSPRQLTVQFEADRIRLANGRELAAPPGVQDTASQFVQLTWLFTTQPHMLEPGRSIDLPLALPRHVDVWTYDVRARERLATPFGEVEAVHVKPRREPKPGLELTAEMWVAPTLQYLPARIVIRQDADTWVDLMIASLPLQAAEPAAAASATGR